MATDVIDASTFAELQDTAGAEFVAELVGTFLEEAPQMLAELRKARAAARDERFRREAHSLKSNCNTFGASAWARWRASSSCVAWRPIRRRMPQHSMRWTRPMRGSLPR